MFLAPGVFFVDRSCNLYRKAQIANAKSATNELCHLNTILIFRRKNLTPSLNEQRYTVLYEEFCWSVIPFAISSAIDL